MFVFCLLLWGEVLYNGCLSVDGSKDFLPRVFAVCIVSIVCAVLGQVQAVGQFPRFQFRGRFSFP